MAHEDPSPLQALVNVMVELGHPDGCYNLPDYVIDSLHPEACLCGLNQARKALSDFGSVETWASPVGESHSETGLLTGVSSDLATGEYVLIKEGNAVILSWSNVTLKDGAVTFRSKIVPTLLTVGFQPGTSVSNMLWGDSSGTTNVTVNASSGYLEFSFYVIDPCGSKYIPDSSITWPSGFGIIDSKQLNFDETKVIPISGTDGDWSVARLTLTARFNGLLNVFIFDIINVTNPTINQSSLLDENHEAILYDDITVQKNDYLEVVINFTNGTAGDVVEVEVGNFHIM